MGMQESAATTTDIEEQMESGKSESSGCCCKSWSKKKKCCVGCSSGIAIVAMVLIILFVLAYIRRTRGSQDVQELENALKIANKTQEFDIDGEYNLVSFTDSYEDYLKALGAPWWAIPLVLAGSETMHVRVNYTGATMGIETGFKSQENTFEWDTWFNASYGNNAGIMWTRCIRTAHSIIDCKMEERAKDWFLTSKILFSESGAINERAFLNKNITTKKYYEKKITKSL